MILVMSITLVCVVLGAPSIPNYTIRSKLVEALTAADSAKTAVSITCSVNPIISALNNNMVGFDFHESKYVKDVKVDGSCRKPVITVFTANTGSSFDPIIAVHGEFLADTGHISWACVSNGVNEQLPKACRR